MKSSIKHSGVVEDSAAVKKIASRNSFRSNSFSGRLCSGLVAGALFAASLGGCADTAYSQKQSSGGEAITQPDKGKDLTPLDNAIISTFASGAAGFGLYEGEGSKVDKFQIVTISTLSFAVLFLTLEAVRHSNKHGSSGGYPPVGWSLCGDCVDPAPAQSMGPIQR